MPTEEGKAANEDDEEGGFQTRAVLLGPAGNVNGRGCASCLALGSARASRAVFGASPKTLRGEKVRDGEGAIASTRGACAPQSQTLGDDGASPSSVQLDGSGGPG